MRTERIRKFHSQTTFSQRNHDSRTATQAPDEGQSLGEGIHAETRLKRGEQSLPGLVHRRANDIPNTGQDTTLIIVLTTHTHTYTQPALRSSKHTDSREKLPENIQNKTRAW